MSEHEFKKGDRVRFDTSTTAGNFFYETNKGGIMSKLKTLSKTLKRKLNATDKALYKLGWINGDLELTQEGGYELLEFLREKYEKEFGEVAKAEVKEREDN